MPTPNSSRKESYSGEYMFTGKKSEEVVHTYLKQNYENIVDVRDDVEYRKVGVDFIADGIKFEVKSNYMIGKTQTMLFELFRLYHDGANIRLGWSVTTEADIIAVHCPRTKTLHMIKIEDVKRAMLDEVGSVIDDMDKLKLIVVPTDENKTTFLIPLTVKQEIIELDKKTP